MKIEIKGSKAFRKALQDAATLEVAKKIIKKNHAGMERKMKKAAQFTQGYSTGQTRRSIIGEIRDDGLTSIVEPTTEYAEYVERGTRFMSAQPFVKPAFNQQKEIFKQDLQKLI
ncbi:TPA: HK97-gp10 family putative phage morphogenesis protein [Streptococcus suis]